MATVSPPIERSTGRVSFWAGLAVCLLGVALAYAQFNMKRLVVPWYSPALATLGALLLLLALSRRVSVVRVIALLLVTAFAGFQWYFLGVLMKAPAYEGPALAGSRLPAFRATFADGRPFTEVDLRDGSRRVM